jgi:uncharacterized protein (TIGR02453 family)
MKEVLSFLADLKANNDREWFQANKERYLDAKGRYEGFVASLLKGLADEDYEMRGVEVKESVFRIYRDTRFANDKTPYKSHMGAFMARGGRTSPRAGYYFHAEPGNCLLAGGIWCPGPMLKDLRREIFLCAGEFEAIVNDPKIARYYALDEERMLKRVPAPFPADDPDARWTRYKSYTLFMPLDEEVFDDPEAVDRVAELLLLLHPFNHFLNYTVDEMIGYAPD